MIARNVTPGPRGIPLWIAVVGLLGIAAIAVGAVVFLIRQASDDRRQMQAKLAAWQLEQTKTEIARKKAEEDANGALARSRQAEALAQVRQATNTCAQVLRALEELNREAKEFLTNDAGKQAARFPDLVALARRFYEVDLKSLPSAPIATVRLEGERRLELQLLGAAGTAFDPGGAFLASVQADILSANQDLARVQQARSLLASLITDAKVKIPPADAPVGVTLEDALAANRQSEVATRQRTIVAKTAVAKAAANESVASAEADRILAEAKAKAASILAEADAVARKQGREQLVRDAQQSFEDTKTKVTVDTTLSEAQKVANRAKLKDPKVRSQLASLTTPGFLQTDGRNSYERRPMSYNGLVQSGALSPDERGLVKLVHFLSNGNDRVRPRVRFVAGWRNLPDERDRAIAIQQLLIELGPTMVEMGMLDP